MSIRDIPKKIKGCWEMRLKPLVSRLMQGFDVKEDTFIVLTVILVGLAGFGLGKLSALEKSRESVTIKPAQFTAIPESGTVTGNVSVTQTSDSTKGMLVASKTGTKYYFPWCSGVAKISEKNKVWFDSYESAQSAGLTAAANCPGLK